MTGRGIGSVATPTRRWVLLPRFPEPISIDFYRLTGKLRLFAIVVLAAANYGSATQLDQLGIDRDFWWDNNARTSVLWGIDLVLTLVIWRARLDAIALRRLTVACLLVETAAAVMSMQALGTVNSHMVLYGFLQVLVYRLVFDFWTGVLGLLTMAGGMWGVVVAESSGWLRPQPMLAEGVDAIYAVPSREASAMVMITAMLVVAFVFANWAVSRMRHRELTIRMLRESLYATGTGRVGRHSGKTLCGTYQVGTVLGTGGMGEVYTGYHQRTRRPLAIKLLHPHLIEDATLLRRFRREAEITGRLGSPHIVNIVDIDEDDGQPFIVFELLDGKDLATVVRERGPLPLELVAAIVDQTARGVAVAHDAGVVHRDLKPENLFLTGTGDDRPPLIKILDFGVSKIAGAATAITQEIAILGTPDFMAPEQAMGHVGEVDRRADIFALGGIAYFAITGQRPFEGGSVPSTLRRIVDEEPRPIAELRADVPAAVADAIAIAMAKRPDERYEDARAFATALAHAIDGDPADALSELAARAANIHKGAPATRSVTSAVTTAETVPDKPAQGKKGNKGDKGNDPYANTEFG